MQRIDRIDWREGTIRQKAIAHLWTEFNQGNLPDIALEPTPEERGAPWIYWTVLFADYVLSHPEKLHEAEKRFR
jgi:hypothetical protein